MINRSVLKEGMYVRMSDVLDNNSFWSRLMKGRYFKVEKPATEPDDATCWSMTYGTLIMYGMNYFKQACNTDMNEITKVENERLNYIFKNKEEFKDLFIIGKKINRTIGNIDEVLNDLEIYSFNLWDISDSKIFIERIREEVDYEVDACETELQELEELFDKLEKLLDELTCLEDKYVRKSC
ncbi:hypothetical protein NE686_17880 [Tissierella carlieri]|uniref:Uncharacterized protein n=1 Tax=Tissierella carlieri TaxID=689904 RepID=A0ABT1SFC7_9FIRM|nr:hypothetical protein [Tissierella carlieri]MCQ4924975.1 hypothetical protein [Tissierella carlieri]